jgi:hypothetical protein
MGTTSATTVAANVNYRVDFRAEESQKYGFDAPSTGPLQRHYRTERIGDTDYPRCPEFATPGHFAPRCPEFATPDTGLWPLTR